ncbi:ATP-binding protein [Pelagicoccus enzymogenes]|uniref:ATP-binding protein n=1 Tax=Pelagicoccus enzymogenes TaxID=2773457 RepID=UPI003CE4A3A3
MAFSCRAIPPSGIAISISDNGSGVDPETQSQLFTHGFTTKPDGHGFGLHGSTNAIKSAGGKLSLESAGPNQGATATITLPR